MSNEFYVLPLSLFAIIVAVGYIRFYVKRSQEMLENWADKHHYQILSASFRPFFNKGPYFYATKGQGVFRVQVQDEIGDIYKGWVRCGHWLAGLASDEITVQWDS